jgi:hypothetical protein
VKVGIDGQPLTNRLDATLWSLDPGEHRFTFETPGSDAVEKTLVLEEGQRDRHEVVVVAAAPEPPASTAAGSPRATLLLGAGASGEGQAAGAERSSGVRTAGLVVGGAGIAGIAAGAAFGLAALSRWSSAKDECTPSICPPPAHEQAVRDHDAASTDATIATIALAAGGAAVATGALLLFVVGAPKPIHAGWRLTPALGVSGASLLWTAAM